MMRSTGFVLCIAALSAATVLGWGDHPFPFTAGEHPFPMQPLTLHYIKQGGFSGHEKFEVLVYSNRTVQINDRKDILWLEEKAMEELQTMLAQTPSYQAPACDFHACTEEDFLAIEYGGLRCAWAACGTGKDLPGRVEKLAKWLDGIEAKTSSSK